MVKQERKCLIEETESTACRNKQRNTKIIIILIQNFVRKQEKEEKESKQFSIQSAAAWSFLGVREKKERKKEVMLVR